MKKLLIIAIIAFNATSIFAQTQKFDIMTFTPPNGWTVQNGDNAKVFTKIDKSKNTLGIIMLYPSINSSGNANDDFKYVWKQIVQGSFGASANPEMETGESNGFKVVNGGELIKYEGIQALAMLTVLSGKGKVISILTITNEQSYVQFTQTMIDGMTIDAKETAKVSPNSANKSESMSFSGSVSDYSFTTPPSWTRQNKANEIVLSRDNNRYVVSCQPTVRSSGNLEADADKMLLQVFQGWSIFTDLGYSANYGTFEKGKTVQGLDYFLAKRYIKKNSNPDQKMDAIILLVKVGNNVAVISAAQPFQDIQSYSTQALNFLLYDFAVKGVSGTANLQKDLLGTWTGYGGVVVESTYHPNNTFSSGGASQTRTSRDAYTDRVTTTSFATDGSYTLNGNLLTKNFVAHFLLKEQIRKMFLKYSMKLTISKPK